MTLRIDITANGGRAKKELKAVAKSVRGVAKETKRAGKQNETTAATFKRLGQETMKAVGAYALLRGGFDATIGLVKTSITEVAAFGDETVKMARNVGVSADALQTYQFAAGRAGVELSSLRNGLKRLSRNMLDAQQGSASMSRMFEALGVSVTDANGDLRSTDAVFRDLADGLAPLGESAESAGARMLLLGRSGAEMGNLMAEGSAGLDKMGLRLDEVGGRLSGETLRATEVFQDSVLDMETAFFGMKNEIASGLMPELSEFFDGVSAFLSSDANTFGEVLVEQTQFFFDLAGGIGLAVKELAGFNKATDAGNAVEQHTERLADQVNVLRDIDKLDREIAASRERSTARFGESVETGQLVRERDRIIADLGRADIPEIGGLGPMIDAALGKLQAFKAEVRPDGSAPGGDSGAADERAAAIRVRLAEAGKKQAAAAAARAAAEAEAQRQALVRHQAELDLLGLQIGTQHELDATTDEFDRKRIAAASEYAALRIALERDLTLGIKDEQTARLQDELAVLRQQSELRAIAAEEDAAFRAQMKAQSEERAAAEQANAQQQFAFQNQVADASISMARGVSDAIVAIDARTTKSKGKAAKRAFAIQKAAAIASAVVGTASAVVNASQTVPFLPAGIAAAVTAGVMGAAQIATIAAQAPPSIIADAGLSPEMAQRMMGSHTTAIIRRDEAVIDPKGTREISQMLAIQRRQMELDAGGGQGGAVYVAVEATPETLRESAAIASSNNKRQGTPTSGVLRA